MTKALITAALLLALATPAAAELCTAYGDMAEEIMSSHQAGVSMARVMAIMENDKILQQMVMEAYGEPRYSSPEFQRRAVAVFRDAVYLQCVKDTR